MNRFRTPAAGLLDRLLLAAIGAGLGLALTLAAGVFRD